MCTTTKFHREITYGYHTYFFAIFFSEQRHCSGLLCFFDRHYFGHNRNCCLDLFVDNLFHLCNLFCCHSLEMCKVKTQSGWRNQRTFLFYMASQYRLQCFLKQMRCAVVLAGILSLLICYFQSHFIALGKHTGNHMTYMTVFSTTKLNGIFYLELTILSIDHTCVTFLSTHGSIEWCLCCKYCSLLTFYQRIYQFSFRSKHCDLRLIFQGGVSGKLCSDRYIDLIVYSSICTHVIGHFATFTGTFSPSQPGNQLHQSHILFLPESLWSDPLGIHKYHTA